MPQFTSHKHKELAIASVHILATPPARVPILPLDSAAIAIVPVILHPVFENHTD